MLKIILEELVKNLKKQPGWIPLLLVLYALVAWLVPEKVSLYGKTFPLSRELLATVLTFVLY